MRIAVLGAGAWGASLAKVLHENGNAVTLWDINAALLDELKQGHSERLLPGVEHEPDGGEVAPPQLAQHRVAIVVVLLAHVHGVVAA